MSEAGAGKRPMAQRGRAAGPPPPPFTELNDLCNEAIGSMVLFATDDWFAVAENLIKVDEPEWREGVFTEYGKWMDGWETRRKRSPGHDWAVLRLGVPGVLRGVTVDTAFFTGNYAPRFSLQAAQLRPEGEEAIPPRKSEMGGAASEEALRRIRKLRSEEWVELIPMTPLKPGYEDTRYNYFPIDNEKKWTHLRLNMYPDGGIARLRTYGEAKPDKEALVGKKIDLISMINGGVCVGYSDAHYGHPRNIIRPQRGINMGDGWETARRLDRPPILTADENGILQVPGNEWASFRLGYLGSIEEIEIDTNHFKGNFPDSVKVEGTNDLQLTDKTIWQTILNLKKLSPHKNHSYPRTEIQAEGPFSFIRITIAPDGGISRVRTWGRIV